MNAMSEAAATYTFVNPSFCMKNRTSKLSTNRHKGSISSNILENIRPRGLESSRWSRGGSIWISLEGDGSRKRIWGKSEQRPDIEVTGYVNDRSLRRLAMKSESSSGIVTADEQGQA